MSERETVRQRTVTWQDPHLGAAQIPEMSGLDYVRAMIDGRVPAPPIAELMRMTISEAEVARVTFRCWPDESHYNPIGAVHGGLVCTLLDSAVGCAVQTTLPRGQGYTSVEIKVNYLRPVHAQLGEITCVGTVTKPGSRIAFAEGAVTDADGKLLATASSTLLVFRSPVDDLHAFARWCPLSRSIALRRSASRRGEWVAYAAWGSP